MAAWLKAQQKLPVGRTRDQNGTFPISITKPRNPYLNNRDNNANTMRNTSAIEINPAVKAPGTTRPPLVITTINPHGSIEWQTKCIASFQKSGHDVVSVNHRLEADKLQEMGIAVEVLSVDDAETGLQTYGKGIPQVLSALKRAREYSQRDSYILVNSDIYYAGRKPCITSLLNRGHAAAVTRSDICDPEIMPDDTGKPYRNGLDIFIFSDNGLDQFIQELERNYNISRHMVFGVPGWDYLAGVVVAKRIGGKILDCQLFKHKIHKQTYSSIGAFENLMPYIKATGLDIEDSAHIAAAQLVDYITYECNNNSDISTTISSIYANHGEKNAKPSNNRAIILEAYPELVNFLCSNQHLLAELYGREKLIRIKRTARSAYLLREPEISAIKNIFLAGNSFRMKICQLILFASFTLNFRQCKNQLGFTTKYPKENSHKTCLELIERIPSLEQRLYQFTELFYTELLEYNIYNGAIMKLLISHQTDREYLGLIKDQLSIIEANLR